MRVPYDEGPATHVGPESCTVVGNDGSEALTGERVGRVSSREIKIWTEEPRLWSEAEGNTGRAARARRAGSSRGRRPRACADASRTGTGRAHDRPGGDGLRVRAILGDRGR